MAQPFPSSTFLSGNYAPLRTESDAPDLIIDGDWPADLRGTLYRNGPNPLYAPRDRYHPFAGDGMLHAFAIADGRVAYRNRWVRTAKWQLDRDAGEELFGTFGNPLTSDPRALGIPFNVANTSVIWQGGQLLALEEGNPPVAIDPVTLETRGPWRFADRLDGPMTAHPKIDPVTGEMSFFGYSVGGFGSADIGFHVANADGTLTRTERFTAPFASMVHDFIVTERAVVFPIFPATLSVDRVLSGGPYIAWEPERPAQLGIMARTASTTALRWLAMDPCYVFHPINAFDQDGAIVADMAVYPAAPGFPLGDGQRADPTQAVARLERWTFAADASGSVRRTPLDDLPAEFPRFDERYAGLPYRHAFYAAAVASEAKDVLFDTIAHLDLASGRRALWTAPLGDLVSEPIFVPRSATAPEGDGWLLVVVFRAARQQSDLVVLDATDVAAGPRGVAHLDGRVPNGFHGTWRPGL